MDLGDAVKDILEALLRSVGIETLLRLVFAHTSREQAQAILDAEFAAADLVADKAEDEKFGPKP